MDLPYLTGDVPGIGGAIKRRPEDFFVQELPLYDPAGAGEHVYCEIQKIGLTTFEAVERIAAALGVSSRDIGYAGMKDAHAVSRQILSILGTSEEAVTGLKIPDIQVMWADRHGNKLRLGHLRGNRFAVKIRDVSPTDVVKVQPMLDRMERSGMPNYFGQQRFGRRDNNHLLGAALLRGDDREVLHLLLGNPLEKVDDPETLAARKSFDAGDLEAAMKKYPRRCGLERRILARLIKTGKPGAAARAVDEKLRRLWINALQSALFNRVVARRIATLDRVLAGDLAMKEENGAVFLVEDAAAAQPRCERFEISPTGPQIGYRMTLPAGEALPIEQAVFDEAGLKPADFRVAGRHKIKGARRPLRVRPSDVELSAGVDEHGAHITVAFSLPAGSFATVLLREIMKTGDD
ncbi:MAG TPA: tRNA pseudouridine(13) synthase TruD [Tepidisphaeraceae bacterium]|nr:tRNA pseudouridine(13) synthase TruD [Tepidisphaeraceae bacterium]